MYPIMKNDDISYAQLFEAAASIGYCAVEMWERGEDFSEEIALAQQFGLTMASMIGHGSINEGFNKADNHDRIIDELTKSIDIAAKHGIPGLICLSGNRNHGQSDDEALVVCARGLRRIAPYAESKGVNLNIELLNSKIDHPGYQCDHTDWGVALCQMVSSPRVKLLYDIYHMQIMEGDIIRTLRRVIDHVGHIHTAGNPGRNDMDDSQELNYAGIARAIAQMDHDLYVGHEFVPKADLFDALKSTYQLFDVK